MTSLQMPKIENSILSNREEIISGSANSWLSDPKSDTR